MPRKSPHVSKLNSKTSHACYSSPFTDQRIPACISPTLKSQNITNYLHLPVALNSSASLLSLLLILGVDTCLIESFNIVIFPRCKILYKSYNRVIYLTHLQSMVVSLLGVLMVPVQSLVEVERRFDIELVPTHHQQMKEKTAVGWETVFLPGFATLKAV